MQPQPTQLDPQLVNLAKSIRQTESGGNFQAKGASGEYGAYQFTDSTWKAQAPKFGVTVPLKEATPEQQNEVAYKQLAEWKQKNPTWNVGNFASAWNAGAGEANAYTGTFSNGKPSVGTNSMGVKYSVPDYAKSVANAYQTIKAGGDVGADPNNPSSVASQATESPSVSGFIGNVASSAGNVVSGLAQAIMHPIDTASNLLGMAGGAIEKPFGVHNEDTQKFDNLVGFLKNRYGGDSLSQVMGHIAHTAYTDPVGMALDLSTVIDGVGAGVSALSKVSDAAEITKAATLLKSASDTLNPISAAAKIAKPVANAGMTATRSIASHLFSLSDPASVSEVLDNPSLFSKTAREGMDRAGLAEDFGKAIDDLHGAVREGGAAYKTIATGGDVIKAPENWIQDVLTKGTSAVEAGSKDIPFGLKLENIPGDIVKGTPDTLKVTADTNSFTRNPSDIAAIQHFVDTWGSKTDFTPKEFLNMRSDLSALSKFGKEIGRNDAAELVSKALRADANKTMRPQIRGLKNLDETQAPIIERYNQVKKDFLTTGPNGYEFKPGAINKIANATGKGKDVLLQRMEQISPGITKRIQIMKAIEDWESASKAKVGAYTRGIVEGGGLMTGQLHVIAAAIITNPAVALPLLRGLGWSAAKMRPLLDLLKKVVNTSSLKYAGEAGILKQAATPSFPQQPAQSKQ